MFHGLTPSLAVVYLTANSVLLRSGLKQWGLLRFRCLRQGRLSHNSLRLGLVCLPAEFLDSPHRVEVEVEVTLRLTVSQSVSLGDEPHLGLMTRYLAITMWQLRSCFCGAPSLTRGRVCLLYMLLTLAGAVLPLSRRQCVYRAHI
jgi:hypothetical protein